MSSALRLCLITALLSLTAGQEGLNCSPQKTFPHPDDCARYYYCDNTNTPQVFFCPPNVHYNPDSGQCDLPESAPCPYVPGTGKPSVASLPEENQSADSSPAVDEGLVVGQSYTSSIPNTRQFYTPDLTNPSMPLFLGTGQPSDTSLPGDEGLVSVQSYASSLPITKEFYTPESGPPSVSSFTDLEQPYETSTPSEDEVVPNQSYVPIFPGRGGPIFPQPEAEDRKDNVGDIIYENKSENTSDSYGTFFLAMNNFEKTLEEGRQKEEGVDGSDFVDVKRQAPADDGSVSSWLNFTAEPLIVSVKEEGNTESIQTEETSEVVKTEGRCSADSEFFGRKAPTDAVDLTSTSEKSEESSTTSGVDKEPKSETDSIVWPLFPLTNLSVVNDDIDTETSKIPDYPTVKRIELDTKNLTDEEKSTFNYPTFTILNLNETVLPQDTETARIENIDEQKDANESKTPEKVEEIEEAKGTIIFESHSEEEENDKVGVPEEGLTKVVIKETAIL